MANSIDERVVKLTFDNAQFEKSAKASLDTLKSLKEALKFNNIDSSTLNKLTESINKIKFKNVKQDAESLDKALEFKNASDRKIKDIDNSINKMNINDKKNDVTNLDNELQFKRANTAKLESIQSSLNQTTFEPAIAGVKTLEDRFSTLGIIGMTAISNITTSVMNLAGSMAGSILTSIPNQMITGSINRAAGIKQAKFQIEGLKNVSWEKISEDIDYGVKDTAYSFDAAAKAASMFAASGIQAGDDMKAALRGVSGVAAMTNQSYEVISDIFSTVAGTGALMGNDITRLGFYGMNAAATMTDFFKAHAEEYQYLFDQSSKFQGKKMADVTESDVRDLASERVIDFKTFATAMNDAFGEHAKDANKTFQGALSNVKAALARTWVDAASAGFDAARDILNAFRDIVNKFNKLIKPVSDILSGVFKDVGAYITDVLNNISSAMDGEEVQNVFKTFGETFSSVVDGIKKGAELILPILQSIGGLVVSVVTGLIIPALSGLGDFISGLNSTGVFDSLSSSVTSFFDAIRGAVEVVSPHIQNIMRILGGPLSRIAQTALTILSNIIQSIAGLITGLTPMIEGVATAIEGIIGGLVGFLTPGLDAITGIFTAVSDGFANLFQSFGESFGNVGDIFAPFEQVFTTVKYNTVNSLTDIKNGISEAVSQIDFKSIFDTIKTNIKEALDGVIDTFSNFVSTFGSTFMDLASQFIDMLLDKVQKIALIWDQIGIAYIGYKIANGITGFVNSILFSLKAITGLPAKIGLLLTSFKKVLNASAILMIAGSMLLFAMVIQKIIDAIQDVGSTDYETLAKGIVVVGIIIAALYILVKKIQKIKVADLPGVIASMFVLMVLASTIKSLIKSLAVLAGMPVEGIAAGIVAMTLIVVLLMGMLKVISNTKINVGDALGTILSLVAIAIVLKIAASAIGDMAKVWSESKPGAVEASVASLIIILAAITVALRAIASITKKYTPEVVGSAAASLLIASASIKMIAWGLSDLAGMDVGQLLSGAAGITVLVAALTVAMTALSKVQNKYANTVNLESIAKALVTASISIKIIAWALSDLAGFDAGNLFAAAGSITLLVAALVAALAALAKLKDKFASIDLMSIAKTLLVAAAAMYIVSGAIAKLAGFDPAGVIVAAAAITLTFAALTASIGQLAKAVEKVPNSKLAALAGLMIVLSLSVGHLIRVVTESIATLAALPIANVAVAGGILAATFAILIGAFAGFVILADKLEISAGDMIIAAAALLIVAKAMEILASGLATLAQSTSDTNVMASAMLVLVMTFAVAIGALVGLTNLAKKLGGEMIIAAVSIFLLAFALGIIANALTQLANVPSVDNLVPATAALTVVLFALVGSVILLSKFAKDASIQLIVASVALYILAHSIGVIALGLSLLANSSDDPAKIMAASAALSLLFVSLAATLIGLAFATKLLNPSTVAKTASALIGVAVAMLILAGAVFILSHAGENLGETAALVAMLAGLMIVFSVSLAVLASVLAPISGAALAVTGIMLGFAVAIAIIAAAIWVVSDALGKLVDDFSKMTDAMKKLDSMTFDFSSLSTKMMMLLAAFEIMSAAAWSAIIPSLFGGPGALESFATTFDKMTDALGKLDNLSLDAEKIDPAIDKIVQVLNKMASVKVDWTQIFGGADQMEKYGPILSDMANAFQQIQDLSLDLDGVDAAIDKIVQVLEKMSLAASRSNSLHIDAFFGLFKMDYGGGADNFTKFAAAIKPMADALNEISGLELNDKYEANLETLKNFIDKVKEWGTTGMFNEWGTDVWFKSSGADTFMRLGIGIKDMAEGLNVAKDALAGMGDPNQIGSYISGLQGFIDNLVGEIQKLSSIPSVDKGSNSLKDVLGSFKDLGEGLQSISSINFDGMGDDTTSLEDKITRLKENLTNVFKLFTEKQEGQDKSFVEQFQDEKIKTAMEQMGSIGQTLTQLTSPLQQINSMDIDTGGVSEKLGTISTFIGDMMNTMNSSFDVKGYTGNKIGEIDPKAMTDRIEAFKHMAEAVQPMVSSLGGISGNQLSAEQFSTVTEGLKNLFTEMGKLVGLGGEGQNGMFTGAGTMFNTVNDQVNAFKTFGESISSIMTGMSSMGTIDAGAFSANITQIKNFMTDLWQNAEDIKKGAETLKELSKAINGEEGNGFIEAIKKLGENFDIEGEGGINGKIQSMLNKLNEIPGKLAEVGGQIEASDFPNKVGTLIDNALQGINSKQGEFGTAAHNLLQAMQNEVDASVAWLTGMGTNAIAAKIVDGINAASVDVNGFCGNIESALTTYNWKGVGESVVSGFKDGLYATEALLGKARQVAREAYEAAKKELDINSPSKLFAKLGGPINEGIGGSMLDNMPIVQKAGNRLIRDSLGNLYDAVEANSPSKLFAELGSYCVEGLALGVQSTSYLATESVIKMASDMMRHCADVLNNSDNIEYTPDITPVISMSDVQTDANRLSTMLSPQSLTPRLSTNLGFEAVTEQNISLQNDAVVDEVSKLRGEVQTYTEAVLTHIGSTYIDGISVNDNDAIHDTFIEMLYDLKRRAAMNGGR